MIESMASVLFVAFLIVGLFYLGSIVAKLFGYGKNRRYGE